MDRADVVIFEAYLPVTSNPRATPPAHFRLAFNELADEFGFVETWPVYRQLQDNGVDVTEQEFCRYQVEAADTYSNRQWLLRWRDAQEKRFGCEILLIRFRLL